jgi:hypothetical protein
MVLLLSVALTWVALSWIIINNTYAPHKLLTF